MKVSVIITAHNRRRYLKQAIESVLQQSPSIPYEIIVVKNFEDEEIDTFMAKKGVISILCNEQNVGEMLAAALRVSSGDIISFLDDDDLFYPEKLKIVVGQFIAHKELVYYHNGKVYIDSEGKLMAHREKGLQYAAYGTRFFIDPKARPSIKTLMILNPGANNSSISIRRELVFGHLEELRSIRACLDTFIYTLSLASGDLLEHDLRPLTKYRVHTENTGSAKIFMNMDEYMRERRSILEIVVRDWKRMLEVMERVDKYGVATEVLRSYLTLYQMSKHINEGESKALILKEYIRALRAGYLWNYTVYSASLVSVRALSYALLPKRIVDKLRSLRAVQLYNRNIRRIYLAQS
ncbi:MAG: glycosyltransferase [Conexivisphaerales archaeon]